MDRFAGIRAFVWVADSGGFTAAARHLNLSKPTISAQVQALEESLGARLLNRTTRRVSLTEIGREYYERCAHILHELDEADQIAGALHATPRGRLRVYCHPGLAGFVWPVATQFLCDYPEVSLELFTGDTMIDLVQERFDLAITRLPSPDSGLIKRTLAKFEFVLCCAPRYLETRPPPRSPADLARHNFLLYAYAPFGFEPHFTDAAGTSVAVRLSGNLVTTSIGLQREATVAGLGLWLAPPHAVSKLLASGALVPLLQDCRKPEVEVVGLYPHRRLLTAKVRAFLDMLADRFTKDQHAFYVDKVR
jgi:DNA-binding transcriptional LysR family regulator